MEKKMLFAAGTYTSLGGPGIRVFALEGERLRALYDVWEKDPIWLTKSRDGRHIYAACGGEGPQMGHIAAFAPAEGDYEKGLILETRQEAHGVCPCHLALAGDDLISAQYADGSISVFPLSNGVPGEMRQHFRHQGHGPNEKRQERAHVHQVLPLSDDCFLAQDLGTDQLVRYEKKNGAWMQTAAFPVPAGDGPRHALAHGGALYLATELSSRLHVFRMEQDGLTLRQTLPLPGADYPGANFPAAIRLCPKGATLAVSCRGADAVAFFRVLPDGALEAEGWAAVHGCWPRDILLLEEGRLLCANERSGDVTLLRRQGKYLEVLDALRFPGPVSLLRLR